MSKTINYNLLAKDETAWNNQALEAIRRISNLPTLEAPKPNIRLYQIKSGRFAGMYHVRNYLGKGRYFHIGRYATEAEALKAMETV